VFYPILFFSGWFFNVSKGGVIMDETVKWLIGIEDTASKIYREASALLKDNPPLSEFTSRLAREEEEHRDLLADLADTAKEKKDIFPAVAIDSGVKEEVEGLLADVKKLISSGSPDRGKLVESIIEAEFSEWNDIFIYVLRRLQKGEKSAQKLSCIIQKHKANIENFLEHLPDGSRYVGKLKGTDKIWTTNILVVEDMEEVAELLVNVLARTGNVDIARNGEDGLEKVKSGHYDIILSDVDMPVMSGIEFYREASLEEPHIGERFIFFSGQTDPEKTSFIEKSGLKCLKKPSTVGRIREAVSEILQR
jgi:CheY-like chemotaxis protein